MRSISIWMSGLTAITPLTSNFQKCMIFFIQFFFFCAHSQRWRKRTFGVKIFTLPGLTAITPLGLKIDARNDRYYTTRSENRRPE